MRQSVGHVRILLGALSDAGVLSDAGALKWVWGLNKEIECHNKMSGSKVT